MLPIFQNRLGFVEDMTKTFWCVFFSIRSVFCDEMSSCVLITMVSICLTLRCHVNQLCHFDIIVLLYLAYKPQLN